MMHLIFIFLLHKPPLQGEQAMSKALVASRLCQAMAAEAADDDLDVEIYDELTKFGKEFDDMGKQGYIGEGVVNGWVIALHFCSG